MAPKYVFYFEIYFNLKKSQAMLEQKLGANHLNKRDPEEVFEIVELLGTGILFFLYSQI